MKNRPHFSLIAAACLFSSFSAFATNLQIGCMFEWDDGEVGDTGVLTVDADNNSEFGGGPFDSPNTFLTFSFPGFGYVSSSLPDDSSIEITGTSLTIDLGLISKYTNKESMITIEALEPGTHSFSGSVEGDLFDPNEDDNECSFGVTVTGTMERNSSGNHLSSTTVGDPINSFNGELINDFPPEINLGGPLPVFFALYYASELNNDGQLPAFPIGTNWMHNYMFALSQSGDDVTIVNNRGRVIEFTKSGSDYNLVAPLDTAYQLIESNGGHILGTQEPQRLYTFGSSGLLLSIEDGRGNTHSLSYDGNDRLSGVTDNLGRALTFLYNDDDKISQLSDGTRQVEFGYSGNNLTQRTDVRGNTTTYSYAGEGLLTSITRPEGNVHYTQTFNAERQVTAQSDALSNTTSIAIDSNTNQTTITEPDGSSKRHDYSESGVLTGLLDQVGQMIAIGSDTNQRRSTVDDREGNRVAYQWDGTPFALAAMTDPSGGMVTSQYTARTVKGITFRDRTKITYPDGSSQSFVYDANGNMTSRTAPDGGMWSYTYNSNGQILSSTSPNGGTILNTYNPSGTLATRTNASGQTTSFTYDGLFRNTAITYPDSSVRSFVFDAGDNVTRVTDPAGNQFNFAYDGNGNLTQVEFPMANGMPGAMYSYTYDSMDRLTSTTDPAGRTTSAAYNSDGLISQFTDGNGKTSYFDYNDNNWLSGVSDPMSRNIDLAFDDEGVLDSTSVGGNDPVTFSNDSRGLNSAYSGQGTNQYAYNRDSLGRITQVVNPLGDMTSVIRDDLGRISSLSAPQPGISTTVLRDGEGLIRKIIDGAGNEWQRDFNEAGLPTKVIDPLSNETLFSYDSRNRLAQVDFPDGTDVTFGYDANGNRTSRTYSGGTMLSSSYDQRGLLTSANGVAFSYDDAGQMTESNGLALLRDGNGNVTSVGYGNGFSINYAFNDASQVIQVSDTSGNTIDFSYDSKGRLVGIQRSNNVDSTISYDSNDFISSVMDVNGAQTLAHTGYTRNALGFPTSISRDQPLMPTAEGLSSMTMGYNASSQLTGDGYSYNARGQMTMSPAMSFGWTGDNNLASRAIAGESDPTQFSYDYFDSVIGITKGAMTTSYTYNYGLNLDRPVLASQSSGSTVQRHFVHGPDGLPLYIYDMENNDTFFYHLDGMGNTLFLSDSGGDVVQSYAYGPRGGLLGSQGDVTNPFTFKASSGVMDLGHGQFLNSGVFDANMGSLLAQTGPVTPLNTNPYSEPLISGLPFGVPMAFHERGLGPDLNLRDDELEIFGDVPLAIEPDYVPPHLPPISMSEANKKTRIRSYSGETTYTTVSEDSCSCDNTDTYLSIAGTAFFSVLDKGANAAKDRFVLTGQRLLQQGLSGNGFSGLATNGSRAATAAGVSRFANAAGNTFSGALGAYTEYKQCGKEGTSTGVTVTRVINSAGAEVLVSAALGPAAIVDAATGGNVSNAVKAPVRVVAALAGSSKDTRAYERAVENGDYGVCLQGWHYIGEVLEEKTGLSDYLQVLF